MRLALVGGGLKDHFQVDRHRVIAGRDHVLLMHVGRGKAVEQRKPGAGAPEKPAAAFPIGAGGVIDEFGPAIAVARDRAHRLELNRRIGPIQSLDQIVPSDIDPQILRLVDDARAIREADDLDRMAAIMRVREIAFDPGDAAVGAGPEEIAPDRLEIGVKAQDKLARRVDPLPRHASNQPQEHRLVFEQTAETAGFHFADKPVVARAGAGPRRGRVGRGSIGLPRLVEALVERHGAQVG